MLWGGDANPQRLLNAYTRLDKRTKWGRLLGRNMGHGPDADEILIGRQLDVSLTEDAGVESVDLERPTTNELETTGFWKESEFLKQFLDMPTKKY